jgi:hypothetical protein
MKVKILVSRQGPGVSDDPGDIRDVDEAEAKRMFEAGEAEPYKVSRRKKGEEPDVETATEVPG